MPPTGDSATAASDTAAADKQAEEEALAKEVDGIFEADIVYEVPWCSVCLVLTCILLHFVTLWGHLSAASALTDMGQSSSGWATVGLSVSEGLNSELDEQLLLIQYNITNITEQITQVEQQIDGVLSMTGDGIDSLIGIFGALSGSKSAASALQAAKYNNSSSDGHPLVSFLQDSAVEEQAAYVNALFNQMRVRKLGADSVADWVEESNALQASMLSGVKADSVLDIGELLGVRGQRTNEALLTATNMVEPPELDSDKLKKTFMDAIKKAILTTLLKKFIAMVPPKEFKAILLPLIRQLVISFMKPVNEQLNEVMVKIKPTLLSIADYTARLSPQADESLNDVGWVLERTQKLYDQIVANVISVGGDKGEEKAKLSNITFKVFDVDGDNHISKEEFANVSKLFDLHALQDVQGNNLFKKYSNDGEQLDVEGYFGLMSDDLTASMIIKLVTELGGRQNGITNTLKTAEVDGLLTAATANYLGISVVMHTEGFDWVTTCLVNGSLSQNFTAGVIIGLTQVNDTAMGKSGQEIGEIVLKQMVEKNMTAVLVCLKMLSETKFWVERGFDAAAQTDAVKKLTRWLHTAANVDMPGGNNKTGKTHSNTTGNHSLLQTTEFVEAVVRTDCAVSRSTSLATVQQRLERVLEHAKENNALYFAEKRRSKALQRSRDFTSEVSRCLRQQLLGGMSAMKGAELYDHHPADEETLNFTHRLAANASSFLSGMYDDCQSFAGRSCNPEVSVGGMVKLMVENLHMFLKIMNRYATPAGVERLYKEVHGFQEKAADDIVLVLLLPIDHLLPDDPAHPPKFECVLPVNRTLPPMESSGMSAMMGNSAGGAIPSPAALLQVNQVKALLQSRAGRSSNVFKLVTDTLHRLNEELPKSVAVLEETRSKVRTVAAALQGPFLQIQDTAPALFATISFYYKFGMWFYFLIVALLTLGLLYYSFWASGFFGGPSTHKGDDYEAPQTFWDRCMCCCRACCLCCVKFEDSELCLWSLIWSMKLFVMILYIMAFVLAILCGVYFGSSLGCGMSSDVPIGSLATCTELLVTMKSFLQTFWSNIKGDGEDIHNVCVDNKLPTCLYMQSEFFMAGIYIALGGVPVPILTFYLLFLSAVMHEQARWRRMFEEVRQQIKTDGVV